MGWGLSTKHIGSLGDIYSPNYSKRIGHLNDPLRTKTIQVTTLFKPPRVSHLKTEHGVLQKLLVSSKLSSNCRDYPIVIPLSGFKAVLNTQKTRVYCHPQYVTVASEVRGTS